MSIDARRLRRFPLLLLTTATVLLAGTVQVAGTQVAGTQVAGTQVAGTQVAGTQGADRQRSAVPVSGALRSTAKTARAALRVIDQTSWVEPGGDAVFELEIEAGGRDIADLDVEAAVASPLLSRGALSALLDGKRLREWQPAVGPVPVSSLVADSSGRGTLRLGTQSPDAARDSTRLLLRSTGAYPLELRLRDRRDGSTIASALTVLSAARRAPGPPPLRVALVWQLGATGRVFTPAGLITDRTALALAEELGPVIRELADEPSISASLDVAPDALEALAPVVARTPDQQTSTSPAIDALRARVTTGDLDVLPSTYGPESLRALLGADLDGEARRQLDAAREMQESALGSSGAAAALATGVIDGPLITHLEGRGVRRVVIDPRSVSSTGRFTPARPFTLTESRDQRSALLAVTTDRELESRLADERVPPGVRAAQLIAGATVTALEQPALERGIAVIVPVGSAPGGTMLVRSVEEALRSHPLLSPAPVRELFDELPRQMERGKPVTRRVRTTSTPRLTVNPGDIRSARARIASLRTLAGSGSPLVRRAERALLLAESGDPDHPARSYLDGALGVVRRAVEEIEGPAEQTVTLIGRRANVPITFVNHSEQERSVEVRLQSDKLLFPEGRRRALVLPPRSTTAGFLVEARTRGSFPLFVTVTSPDGEIVVSRTELTIRSTATSWVGRMLTIAAIVFLLTWWGLHFRRARRRSTLA